MSHRFTPALLCTLILAAVPATATAQAPPPDERAAAQAFADTGSRAMADLDAALRYTSNEEQPQCRSIRRLARATARQQARAFVLIAGQVAGILGRTVEPVLGRAVTELDAVPTADPALRGGRTAWRQIQQVYRRFAAIPHMRLCIELRDYVRGGFKPTPAIKRVNRAMRAASRIDFDGVERGLERARTRLIELGIPADAAAKFALMPDEDEGGGYGASAALNELRASS